ncbi:MAG: YggS family pyridoxal phosphate-dependent enzyme [Lentisphaerae bacterium]|jgi:pyridoxal phosphate enzyme (YggS family)|nr:YggS family pyridoxal phosphate-dependent enzyme [Lentisphaerota bacterium]
MISVNLNAIREQIDTELQKAGRKPGDTRLLAVSKTFPPAIIQEAYDAGQRLFGENKVQELKEKKPLLPDDIEWHLIGHLQQNKVKNAIENAAWIHSIDSEKLLTRINRIADELGAAPKVLLEINISGETSKFGLVPDQAEQVIESGLQGPAICKGLMTMAPADATTSELHAIFAGLRKLRDKLEQNLGRKFPELSMGMTADFPIAIAEGATIVRIGSAIFGHR